MGWRAISDDQIKNRFTPAELDSLKFIQGGNINAALEVLTQNRLPDAINAFLGAMSAIGLRVNTDGSVPDQLRSYVMAMAVWNWLADFPKLEVLRTEARKKAAEDAEKVLQLIALDDYGAIEQPVDEEHPVSTTGNWNSERKILGRMHALPKPSEQFSSIPSLYANESGPIDE